MIVRIDPRYFRPAEVDTLLGDPSKAKKKLGWQPKVTFDALVDEMVREVVRATNPRGFMHGVKLGLVDGYSPAEAAPKFTFPVLLISGREDRVNPIDENAAVLVKALPQGRLEILDGAGHLPEVDFGQVFGARCAFQTAFAGVTAGRFVG